MQFITLNYMSIVITGNPGVGKHTIAKEIAVNIGRSILDINDVAKKAGLFEKKGDIVEVDVSKLEEIIKKRNIVEWITVGHLSPYVLDKNKVEIVIVLRRNPYDLMSVYKERKYTERKSRENASSEILGIIANDATQRFQEKTFQIDVSKRNIQETTKKVMDVINNKKGNEVVDWLEMIEKNNDLKKFFSD